MAKGAYVTPRIKELVAQIYLEKHRQIGPTQAREELLKKMRAEGLDKIFGLDYPSVSTVSKLLKEYNDRFEGQSPAAKGLDEPWGMATLDDYPIPPDVLPHVLRVWKYYYDMLRKYGLEGENALAFDPTLTIRKAKWVGKLAHIIEDDWELGAWAHTYAFVEQIYQLVGKPFDSSVLDYEIMKPKTERQVVPLKGSGPYADFIEGVVKDFKDWEKDMVKGTDFSTRIKTEEAQNEGTHTSEE